MIKLLFGSTPARFDSRFGEQDSVERLRAASMTWPAASVAWWSFKARGPFEQKAVGTVTSSRVTLCRAIHSAMPPQFEGHFVESQGAVALVGRFTMCRFTKFFVYSWLGIALWSLLSTTIDFVTQPGAAFMPLPGVVMLAGGVWVVWASASCVTR